MESTNQIKELRSQTGMSQKEFAEHLGIPLRTIENWESGKRNPPDYLPRLISYQLKYEAITNEAKTI